MPRDRDGAGMFWQVGIWLLFFVLLVPAGVVGWAIGHSSGKNAATPATAPAGHQGGANLAVSAIGSPARGKELFDSKHCSDCHSYNGHGGSDAPPLDFMRGHLSAREIAEMSGTIWDHLPKMVPHFKEEGIPLPTFSDGQMADLIAYLHGGPPGGATTSTPTTTTATPSASTTTAATGSAAQGKQLFTSQGCSSCHTFAAAGATGTVGPNLDESLPADAKKAGKPLAAFVRESILKPNAYVPSGYQPGVMPQSYGTSLSASQIDDLVAFLTQKS